MSIARPLQSAIEPVGGVGTGEPFEPVELARVRLRCVTDTDADRTAALMTPEISRRLSHWSVPFTKDMARKKIETVRALAFEGDALPLAAVRTQDQALMGWIMIHRDHADRSRASFGYWLGAGFQCQGYMRDIAPVAIAVGFSRLAVDVIEAGAQVDHAASFAVMRHCGMRQSGERWIYAPARRKDEFCRFFEVRREDWSNSVIGQP